MTGDPLKSPPGEFEIIDSFFAPLSHSMAGAYGLTDDAATLAPEPGMALVMTKDAMVSGVHFLDKDNPADIARKLLRVNLSDLAAMGATPVGYLLATFWPVNLSTEWIRSFTDGLAKDQQEFKIGLLGGDTVRTSGPLCLSLTAVGQVPAGQALRRNGGKAGDLIVVSGTIGDGALGLMAARGELDTLDKDQRNWLADRYHLPRPRMALGPALLDQATACADISDGLVADIGHICTASGVGAVLKVTDVPLSDAVKTALYRDPALLPKILTGGDDYELVFTLPTDHLDRIPNLAVRSNTELMVIGYMETGDGVTVLDHDGVAISLSEKGWRHF